MPVSIRQCKNTIETISASPAPLSLMLWGDPGIGKTAAVEQAAIELGIGFKAVLAHLWQPVDVLGLPYILDRKVHYAPPTVFPDESIDGPRGIFFIDELPKCVPAMMSAWGIIILERSTKHYKFPPGWSIVCAGNHPSQRTGSTRLISDLENRLAHYDVVPKSDEFYEYAMAKGLHRHVLGFLDFTKGSALLRFDPKSTERSFPSPRAWERVSDVLAFDWTGRDNEGGERDQIIAGLIGQGTATEFINYLKVYARLPRFDEILANQVDFSGMQSDMISAIMGALLAYVIDEPTQGRVDQVLAVAARMPNEWRTFMLNRMWNYGSGRGEGGGRIFASKLRASPHWAPHAAYMQGLNVLDLGSKT